MTRRQRAGLGAVLGAVAAGVWVAVWRWADAAPLSGDLVASGMCIGYALFWAMLEWPALKAELVAARFTRASEMLAPLNADTPGIPRVGTSAIRRRFAILVLAAALHLSAALVGLHQGSVALVLGGALMAALMGWFAAGDFVTLRHRRRVAEGLRQIGER